MRTSFLLYLAFLGVLLIALQPRVTSQSVPTALIACKPSTDNSAEYLCDVTAQCPEGGCPAHHWSVSNGRIIGTTDSSNIRIDTRKVRSGRLKVACRVKWPNPYGHAVLIKTISLH
jgi:hypothetical protein